MDSSDVCEEITFSFNDLKTNRIHFPLSISVSGIHRAVLEGDIHKIKYWIVSGQSINSQEIHYNFSPLHLAVIYNNLEILDYLLAREGIEVDVRCSNSRTPLSIAVMFGHIESVEKLIQAGSDVNIADSDNNTALYLSVLLDYSHICHLLLQHGAQVYNNNNGNNALKEAVIHNSIEIVSMLLYYNVDANFLDPYNCTPFTMALHHCHEEIQEVLLEYVDDFDRICYSPRTDFHYFSEYVSTLNIALLNGSPFVKDMIERGADVNYADDPANGDVVSAFYFCLLGSVDVSVFKMVWERLRYHDIGNSIDLLGFLGFTCEVPTFLQVIIESDNIEPAVMVLSREKYYYSFVNKFAEEKFDLDQLTAFTCRLLEYGVRVDNWGIHAILSNYGYCELFRILLYMDNDLSYEWLPFMALSRLIFNIDYDLKSLIHIHIIPEDTLLHLLEYSICPPLMNALALRYNDDECMSAVLSNMPRVPSLLELARNPARKQIWQAYKVTNNWQFYTTIDHLNIPAFYKDILTFKRKIYEVRWDIFNDNICKYYLEKVDF